MTEEANMVGKIFISCGMHLPEERETALRVRDLLQNNFNFVKPYVAITVQSLDDIMTITKELRSSDYYLFIDFKRESMFTHQELALAHHLGFGSNIIALRERGASDPARGFLCYVLSNPEWFSTTDELIAKVQTLVSDKGWTPNYSRNLVVNPVLGRSGGVSYGDHTGSSFHESWRAKIENRRPDAAAVGAACILDSIRYPSGDSRASPDRGYLKWAGHGSFGAYERTLLPNSHEEVDLFAIRIDRQGLFLLSTLDVQPRQPIVTENGDYQLTYKVFARDFPLLEFAVRVHLQWEQPTPVHWTHRSDANLIG
jgi:hypothetical protein